MQCFDFFKSNLRHIMLKPFDEGWSQNPKWTDCTIITGSCAARKPSNIPCYQIRDRKTCLEAIDQRDYWRSPCGWCFGKHCPGTRNLCEPKKWFDNGRLKAGQDYEDCLKLGKCTLNF